MKQVRISAISSFYSVEETVDEKKSVEKLKLIRKCYLKQLEMKILEITPLFIPKHIDHPSVIDFKQAEHKAKKEFMLDEKNHLKVTTEVI